jgi:diaminopimelate epimerase
MRLPFVKMHGLGNDFLVFDLAAGGAAPDSAVLRRLADRHKGIGFDQALALSPGRTPGALAAYRVFNADGEEVEQCGNGARCVAALVARRLGRERGEIVLDSSAGPVRARLETGGRVAVAMGVPSFDPAAVPFLTDEPGPTYALEVPGGPVEICVVSIGNPHAVLLVPDVASAPVDSLGQTVENHPRFPRRCNVGFMEIVAPGHILLRVHERGVGETLACGTGACAAVAVGRRLGRLAATVQVDLPGGRLDVAWPGDGAEIWLEGPTATVFEGHTDL